MALRILRIAHLRGRPPGLAGGMSGARISHSWSERSLGYRHRDENIKGLQKPAMLLIKPHYLPSRTASSPTVPLRSRLWTNGVISREPQLSGPRALLCTICGTYREPCYWDQTPPLVDPATKSRCP